MDIVPKMVFQSEINECGLACIAMLAETQGLNVSLQQLREKHHASAHGTSLARLGEILTELGVLTYPVMFSHDELDALPLPAILHYGAGHYVVLIARKGRQVCVLNPALGQQYLTFDALKQDISGYALVINKEAQAETTLNKTCNKDSKTLAFATMSLQQTAKINGIYKLMMLVFLISLTLFVMPVMVSQSINEVLYSAGQVDFPYALYLLAFVISTGLAILARVVTERYIKQFVVLNSCSGFSRLMSNPLQFFARRAAGDVFSRFSAWENAAAQKIELDNGLRTDWIIGLIAFSVMVYMSTSLALVSLAGVIAMGLVSVWAIYRDRYFTQQLQVQTSEQSEFILESLQGFTTIKSAGLIEHRKRLFARFTQALFSCVQKKHIYEQLKNSIYQMVASIEMVFFMLLALPLLKNGQITMGDFFAYSFIRQIFTGYITKIFYAVIQKNQLQIIDQRAEDLFSSQDEECGSLANSTAVHSFSESISYENIFFSYDSDKVALKHLSLSVRKSESFAIVGESGAGKSTLIKVIAGLLIPQQGTLRVDGSQATSAQISHLFFLQSQEDILFNASVLENITLFDPYFDESKFKVIDELLAALNLDEVVDQLPGGIRAKIRESHSGLSLGQRQRLLLARAMYSSRPVIILDEPTANLDDMNAMQTAKALIEHSQKQGKTLIVVTHSKAILPLFDRVQLIEKGCLPLSSDSLPHYELNRHVAVSV